MPQAAEHPLKKNSIHIIISLSQTPHTRVMTAIQSGTKCALGVTYTCIVTDGGGLGRQLEMEPRSACPPCVRITTSSLRKPKEILVGCDEEPRYVSKFMLIVVNAPRKHTANKLTDVDAWRASMSEGHGLHVRSIKTGGRPAFTEDEAVHQLPHTLVKS